MFSQIYPSDLQLNDKTCLDIETTFLDLDLSITNDIVSSLLFINIMISILKLLVSHFLMEMFLAPSCGVYILKLMRFARVCSNVSDSNKKKFLTANVLKQG